MREAYYATTRCTMPEAQTRLELNHEQIMEILPHRPPMLLVDRAVLIDDEVEATLHLTGEEWFFDGHFPGDPTMPGNLLLEAMAQAGAILLLTNEEYAGKVPLNIGIEGSFHRAVRPGDTVEINVVNTGMDGKAHLGRAEAMVGDKLVAVATLRCRPMRQRSR